MKTSYLVLAAMLAAPATGAFAETGAKIDHATNVPDARITGTVVVTRPSEAVPAGPTTVEGPTAVATVTRSAGVNEVHGRS
jgi:hypothetical protein